MIPTARNVLAHLPTPDERLLGFPTFALRGAARLSFTARIERTPFNRARSASTKDGLAARPPVLLRPRLREHGDHHSYPRSFFSILLNTDPSAPAEQTSDPVRDGEIFPS